MATKKIKASDRAAVSKKIITALKKKYGGSVFKSEKSVLETILYAVCLEDAVAKSADVSFGRLFSEFHDLNEARVSSITEIQNIFRDQNNPEWRAMRIRNILQSVFESQYSFDLEVLRKKTNDQAEKRLKKIKSLSPFVINYVLLNCLGAHVIPVDQSIHTFAKWIGLSETNSKIKETTDFLKSSVRKADALSLFHWLHLLATDSTYAENLRLRVEEFVSKKDKLAEERHRLFSAGSQLKQLLSGKLKKPRKKPAPKPKATPKKKAKAKTTTKVAKKSSSKVASKTVTPKKSAPKKASKKTSVKKAVKKQAPKKAVAKKKAAAKKPTASKKKVTKKSAATKKKTSAAAKKKSRPKKSSKKK